jgi:ABC-type uncharacterized transport system YnjBCD permease subunit
MLLVCVCVCVCVCAVILSCLFLSICAACLAALVVVARRMNAYLFLPLLDQRRFTQTPSLDHTRAGVPPTREDTLACTPMHTGARPGRKVRGQLVWTVCLQGLFDLQPTSPTPTSHMQKFDCTAEKMGAICLLALSLSYMFLFCFDW